MRKYKPAIEICLAFLFSLGCLGLMFIGASKSSDEINIHDAWVLLPMLITFVSAFLIGALSERDK